MTDKDTETTNQKDWQIKTLNNQSERLTDKDWHWNNQSERLTDKDTETTNQKDWQIKTLNNQSERLTEKDLKQPIRKTDRGNWKTETEP